MIRRVLLAVAAGAAALAAAPETKAQLVVGKSGAVAVERTRIAALREGSRTVLSISATLRGEATGELALLVPVPASPTSATLPAAALDALSGVTAPRVAEYWEKDPCEFHSLITPPAPMERAPPLPEPEASAAPAYEAQVLEGKGADVLAALRGLGLQLPAEAEPILVADVDAGQRLVVAKIDAAKLGRRGLPAIRVSFEAPSFAIPSRLFAAGGGDRALDIHVLAPGLRFEAETQANVAVPTNLDVASAARPNLGALYGALLDKAASHAAGAVVTEYAWRASTCELCPAPLGAPVVLELGVSALPSAAKGHQHEVLVEASKVSTTPGGPEDLRAALSACYQKVLTARPGLSGSVTAEVTVTDDGPNGVTGGAGADPALTSCVVDAAKEADLDRSGALTVEFAPLSRRFFGDLVLTKLHARFAGVPERELSLRPAKAIEGGRETGPEGKPEKKVSFVDGANNFQPRYVIRHPFKGAVTCSSPKRGVWGDQPPDGAPPTKPTGKPPKPPKDVLTLVQGGDVDLAAFAIAYQAPPALPEPPPPPKPVASGEKPAPTPAPAGANAPAADAGGGSSTGYVIGALVLAGAAFAVLRLRRRASDGDERPAPASDPGGAATEDAPKEDASVDADDASGVDVADAPDAAASDAKPEVAEPSDAASVEPAAKSEDASAEDSAKSSPEGEEKP